MSEMRFRVSRTSCKPVAGAYKGDVEYVDQRTFKTEAEYDERFGGRDGTWRSQGRDHTTWEDDGEGGIQRTLDREETVFDGDILEFIKKHGRCVVTPPDPTGFNSWSVEIYDDYRE